MSRILLRAVRLRGFGRFDELVARFQPGLNVLARPNEWGKSTLVAGIEAVLFGFTAVAAERGTRTWLAGRERYRSWYGFGPFDGSVLLERDGELFQFYRDFESSRVVVRSRPAAAQLPDDALEPPSATRGQGSGGWVQRFRGLHRPRGTRTADALEALLRELLGLASAELFERTFCLTQLLPEAEQLEAAVHELVTGAGTAGLEQARQRLIDRARALTTRTDRLGLTPEAGRRRRLEEELQARIADLTARLEQARRQLDQRAPLQEQLALARQELERLERAAEDQGRILEAMEEWLRQWHTRQGRLQELASVEQAVEHGRRLLDRLAQAGRELEQAFGLEQQAGEGALARLEQLSVARAAAATLGEELQRRRQRVGTLQDQLEQERRRLSSDELAALQGREDLAQLPGRHRLLVEKAARWRELEGELLRLGQAAQELMGALQRLGSWPQGEPQALEQVRRRRRQAEELVRRWQTLRKLRSSLAEAEAALAELEQEQARLLQRYGDLARWEGRVAALGGDAVELLRQAVEQARRWQALQAWVRRLAQAAAAGEARLRRRLRRWAVPGVVVTVAAGWLGLRAWGGAGLPAGALAVVVAAAAGLLWLVVWRPMLRALRAWRRQRRLLEACAGTGQPAGRATARPDELAAQLQRALDYQERRQQLQERRRRLAEQGVTPAAAENLRWRLAQLQEELEGWGRTAGGAPEADGWQEFDGWLAAVVGAGGGPASWEPASSPTDFLERLSGLSAAFWENLEAVARERDRLSQQLEGIRRRLADDGALAAERARLEEELRRLREATAPFDEAADPAEVAGRVQLCLELRQRVQMLEQALRQEERELGRLEADWEGALGQVQALEQALQPLLAACDGDLEAARQRLQRWEGLRREVGSAREQLRGLLQAFGASDLSELEGRRLGLQRALQACEGRLQALEARYPALPRHEEVRDVASLEEQHHRLQQAVRQTREEAAAAQEAHRQLLDQQALLQQAEPLNVAAAELELGQLRRQLEAVQQEAEAVAEAYRQLEAAAADYHGETRKALEAEASQLFARFTGRPGRRVSLTEQFQVQVVDPDGQVYPPRLLSQGARDQLFLALRLALATLVQPGGRLPFILDDPFVHCDEQRLQEIRRALEEMAATFQVILLTHRRELVAWGHAVPTAGS